MKLKKSQKIIAIVITVVIILSALLVGLNSVFGNKGPKEPHTDVPSPSPTVEPTEETYISVWHTLKGDTKEVLEKNVSKAFKEEYPHISLSFASVNYDYATLADMVEQKKAPDVFILPNTEIFNLATAKIAANLSDFSPTEETVEKLNPGVMKYNMVDSNVYGLPLNMLVDGIYANFDAMEDLGILAEDITIDTLATIKGAIGLPYISYDTVIPYFNGLGGSLFSDDCSKAIGYTDSVESIYAMELIKQLYSNDVFVNYTLENTSEDTDHNRRFSEPGFVENANNGEYLLLAGNSSLFTRMGIDRTLFTPLAWLSEEGRPNVGGESAVIINSSQKKQEAYAFIEFLVSDDGQRELALSGDLPSNTNIIKAIENNDNTMTLLSGEKDTILASYYLTLLDNALFTAVPYADRVPEAFNNIYSLIMAGEIDLELGMQTLAEHLEAVINGEPIPPMKADLTLEAEDAKLAGIAEVVDAADASLASAGKYVIGLNYADGYPNHIIFENINIDRPGTYRLSIRYSSGTNGSVGVLVNDNEYIMPYSLTDVGWLFKPNTIDGEIYLNGDGSDSIKLYDFTSTCFIWIDYIQLQYISDEKTMPSDDEQVSGRYEAEDGYLTGSATIVKEALASGYHYVNGLNFAKGNPNQLIFSNLNIYKPGRYKLTLGYSSGTNGILAIEVNKYIYKLSYNAGMENDWSFIPKEISMEISLKGNGKDIIAFYDLAGFMWIDYFELEFVSSDMIDHPKQEDEKDRVNRIEAEDGILFGKAISEINGAASNGEYVYYLNWEDGRPNNVQFDNRHLNIDKGGTYELRLTYSSATNGSANILANDVEWTFIYTSGDEGSWSWNPVTDSIEICLKGDGTDRITISDNPGSYMWLDYIELVYVSDNVTEPSKPEPIKGRIEAESGRTIGGALVGFNPDASNSEYVYNLNYEEGSPNRIEFSDIGLATRKGRYRLVIGYSSGTSGSIQLYVNNDDRINVPYESSHPGTWEWVSQEVGTEILLKGDGSDRLQISDNPGSYVWLDYIELEFISEDTKPDETEDPEPELPENRIEAEDGIKLGNATEGFNLEASNSKYIYDLTWAENAPNRIKFADLPMIDKPGTYKLFLAYSSGTSGAVKVIVNASDIYTLNYTSSHEGSWEWVTQYAEISIGLNGDGNDKIEIHDASGSYMWLDYIELNYSSSDITHPDPIEPDPDPPKPEPGKTVKIEAEHGELSNVIHQPVPGVASNDETITGFDAEGASVEFSGDIGITKAGTYRLGIVYSTAVNASININVNGLDNAINYPATTDESWAFNPGTVYIEVELKGDGTDIITVTGNLLNTAPYLWLDFITITAPDFTKIEAEDARMEGGVMPQPLANGSNGMVVTGLNDGKLIFDSDLTLSKPGRYNVDIVYYTATGGVIDLCANADKMEIDTQITPGGWNADAPFTTSFAMDIKADGNDVIELSISQPNVYIWIDYINIEYMSQDRDSQIILDNTNGLGTGTIEEKNRPTAQGALVWTGFTNDSGLENVLLFDKIEAGQDGLYQFAVRYSTNTDTRVIMLINDREIVVELPATSNSTAYIDKFATTAAPLLNGADNSITIWATDDTATNLEINQIKVNMIASPQPQRHRIEAESAQRFGMAKDWVVYDPGVSGNYYIKGLNHDIDKSNRIEFYNFPVYQTGSYELTVRYASSTNGQYAVKVNETEHIVDYTKTNDLWDFSSPAESVLNIELRGDGSDRIAIYDKNDGQYISIDYIEISADRYLRDVYTDKSAYNPGDDVNLTVDLYNPNYTNLTADLLIRLTSMGEIVDEKTIPVQVNVFENKKVNTMIKAPTTDFTGYAVEVYLKVNGQIIDKAMSAVDVSSDWTMFPRYGYIADSFGADSSGAAKALIDELTKYHINGLFYFDVLDRHDNPLAGTVENPDEIYYNLAGKEISPSTLGELIGNAKDSNMQSFVYNLMFGAYEDYIDYGISPDWGMYVDGIQDSHPLPAGWETGSLKLFNPANVHWQDYYISGHADFLSVFNFDGIQVDSLGNRGRVTDIDGNTFDLSKSYSTMLNRLFDELDTRIIFNAVSDYGQDDVIENFPHADIIFTELWPWDEGGTYSGIKEHIDKYYAITGGERGIVIPAYVNAVDTGNMDTADGEDFHAPAVRYLNAAIIAAGGSHLELGDTGMLCTPYYADDYLTITEELAKNLRSTYSFMTAYQNLLRGPDLLENDNEIMVDNVLASSEGSAGEYWAYAKQVQSGVTDKDVIQLINLKDVDNNAWVDAERKQLPAQGRKDLAIRYYTDRKAGTIRAANPDYCQGIFVDLSFEYGEDTRGKYLEFTLPYLEYNAMVLVEYESTIKELRLEAEAGTLRGITGSVENDTLGYADNASGGAYIWGLNYTDDQANRVEFNDLMLNIPGQYMMTLRYACGMDGALVANINGIETNIPYPMTDGTWAFTPQSISIPITLKGDGTDSIWFYDSPLGYARLDCIDLKYMEKADVYQAEDAQVNGGLLNPQSGMSSGPYVVGLAYNADHTNNITFTVVRPRAGEYTIGLVYSTGLSGNMGVSVNGSDLLYETELTNINWEFTPKVTYIKVALNSGENIIQIYDPPVMSSYAHIDYIFVQAE